jgi:hypothetical protein
MSETNQQDREPTEAELKAYREKMIQYYKEQIPLLKSQKEYETLLADIEEARAKRVTMTMRIAQIMAGPPQPKEEERPNPPDPASEEERPTRQLRKEEA